MDASAHIMITKGGSEFEAYPLPSIRLGDDDSSYALAFHWLPSQNAIQALGLRSDDSHYELNG
jgi:hypothetical protein